jgi:hypothetical protein
MTAKKSNLSDYRLALTTACLINLSHFGCSGRNATWHEY